MEIYAGEKLVKRFIKVDKLTTATATDVFASVYKLGMPVKPIDDAFREALFLSRTTFGY